MVRRCFFVSGRVQGVGFRDFVNKQAQTLRLKGAVRNRRDGRVEILAVGEEQVLEVFKALVARGPVRAKVDSVETREPRKHVAEIDDAGGFSIVEGEEESWCIDS